MQPVYASKFLSKLSDKDQEIAKAAGIVPVNDAFFPYWDSTFRHEVYYGGRGSGKSKFIAQKLVRKCANDPYFRWQYSRKHQVDIKESQYELLKQTISEFKLWQDFKFNETTLRITHRSGNAFIAKGMDDPEKSKGIVDLSGFWGEEITEFEQEDVVGVNQNLRTKKAFIQSIVGFNPVHEEHWVRHFYFSKEDPHRVRPDLGGTEVIRTTLFDNHFIDREQYAKDLTAAACGNQNIIRVVLEGDWGMTENGNPWLYNFEEQIHVEDDIALLPGYPVYIAFDFNNDPFACTVWQMSPNKGTPDSFIHCLEEISGKFKIEEICNRIMSRYPNSILFVTGDRSGQNEDVGRNQTLYQIIAAYLGLKKVQLNLNTTNLEHADSRLFLNAMFAHYAHIKISRRGCPNLIRQCQIAKCDDQSNKPSQLLKDRGLYKMDEFDSMRYFFQTYFHEFAKNKYFKVLSKK